MTRSMAEIFDDVYARDAWRHGSGTGSSPDYCRAYVNRLRATLMRDQVRSVLDLGCGDWQLYRDLDWAGLGRTQGLRYLGVDVARDVVAATRVNHGLTWVDHDDRTVGYVRFTCADFSQEHVISNLLSQHGPFDMVLIKDVLMHWHDDEVRAFMDALVAHRDHWRTLWVCNQWRWYRQPELNYRPRSETFNERLTWAPIDADRPPLNQYGLRHLFSFQRRRVHYVNGGYGR